MYLMSKEKDQSIRVIASASGHSLDKQSIEVEVGRYFGIITYIYEH